MAYVGDSEADEYAISRLKGVAYTFRVINEDATVITRTSANYRLEGKYFSVKSKLQKKNYLYFFREIKMIFFFSILHRA